MSKKIFISAPISGFVDKTAYRLFRSFVLKLIDSLRQHQYEVCSELEQISHSEDYDSPTKSVEEDFSNIESSDIFLMLHPQRIQTSSLIELGYACAHKKIIVIVGIKDMLPYLAKGLEHSSIKAKIVDIPKFEITQIGVIIDSL